MKCPKRHFYNSYGYMDLDCLKEECAWWMERSLASYDPERKYVGDEDGSACVMVVIADRMKRF